MLSDESIEELNKKKHKIKALNKEREYIQRRLNKLSIETASMNQRLIQKAESIKNRQEFMTSGNAVQSSSDGMPKEFLKEFSELNEEERKKIKDYIWKNTKSFKTKMLRNIKTGQRRQIDIAETCKKACGTDGIPMRLCYKKPTPQKAKLIMFLDISGSCRHASELMLYFMYCMKEIFPGGCKTYAFVNRLYDISDFFNSMDPDAAIQKILSTIPTRGVYSDYGTPFKEFFNEEFHEVTKDSIVFFIGDARGNKNDPGDKYVKAIGRKCKHAYWLNTESRDKWNKNDSVIGCYRPYMSSAEEVLTPRDLFWVLSTIK